MATTKIDDNDTTGSDRIAFRTGVSALSKAVHPGKDDPDTVVRNGLSILIHLTAADRPT